MNPTTKNELPARHSSSTDDLEELLSNTEVEEGYIPDKKDWDNSTLEGWKWMQKDSPVQTALSRYRWPMDIFLVVVILMLSYVLYDARRAPELATMGLQIGGDFTGASEGFPTEITKFEADMMYAPRNMSHFFDDETLVKWNKLMPVNVKAAEPGKTFFTTTMTHQLHCVYMMAKVYSGVQTGRTAGLPHDYNNHFLHCIDYLRQGIMCSADLTLEAHDEKDSDDLGPLDGGWNGHHVCKDYGHVIEYLEEQIEAGIRTVLPIDD